ncbi:MAG TPA: ABC-F family ATP-binding cassette domain-containing protein [Bryobacteraceae bacterium]|nr:ABC-F family ATP-binding cassette domain-containing protein [Bryobacteraceae bacterium]
MPVLLTCQAVSKTYGNQPLFEGISLTISDRDRLGIIGPNGSGKSTFLKILAGLEAPDAGSVAVRKLVQLAYVPQNEAFPAGLTVEQVIRKSLEDTDLPPGEHNARLATTLGMAGFENFSLRVDSLSGGWTKRLSIAQRLVRHPDILLLDEPTNHLDLEGILWLERLLAGASFACAVISHDRYFLENVATGMAEINASYPGGMFRVDGNYSEFLARKEEFLHAETRKQEALATKVRRELEWLRRGPKARTTKAKARIDQAGRLMDELAEVSARRKSASAAIDFSATGRRTKALLECEEISKELGGRKLFENLSFKLSPGMRIGLVGPNGSGKTTLLRMLAGEMEPDAGSIRRAELLRVVYFDQNREHLDPGTTLRRALAPEGDSVIFRGRPLHVNAWARRFLFPPEHLEMPAGRLSGGEQARVLIARLMLQPADLLLLDEPTNDLDIPTLETLEESLSEFPGALVLVTHDRYMMDRISTAVIGLDGQGEALAFADYSQWEDWLASRSKPPKESPPAARPRQTSAGPERKRLSYIESREWEAMEERILQAEALIEAAKTEMQQSAAAGEAARLQAAYENMEASQREVDRLYARWAELEAKRQ